MIDDGGHYNTMIKTSFDHLWPQVKPGGVYFIEDLQAGRSPSVDNKFTYEDTNGQAVVSDIIQAWIEQLLLTARVGSNVGPRESQKTKFPLPDGVEGIFCQSEACMIAKQMLTFKTPSMPRRIIDQNKMLELVSTVKPVSEKFTTHAYHIMYSHFLLPLRDQANVKVLEIGFDCVTHTQTSRFKM